ncbi:RNA ligase family protein [Polyangium sp. 15x6]|uniref:RNA ligase family protein n=1 Tax=Polyangium sp. 15x6 TaxID=3042687 RepID=UPI002499BE28|nr:RNA ligase family protein [Polyangium sp. 15x6]MDI3289024.1 RNA ligase family protein [Polyangium sp. 15x6]
MTFSPYEKIADSLAAALGDDEAAHRAASRAEWIVTEKIHGANFCFVTDGEEVRCAKRKGWLAEDEDFFGHRAVLGRFAGGVRDVLARVKTREPKATRVLVYGELFGGGYPHPDVTPVPGVQPVQTGCWYAPGIEFCAFDVGFVREDASERVYLDQDEAREACEDFGIPFARPLFRGRYEDALVLPLGFETTIPARLGLPSLGPSNKAEGVVLKPARALVVPRRAGVVRPVVKRKIPEFSEDERFHEAEKWTGSRAPSASPVDWLMHEASSLVNENRLNAAVSKVGPTRPGDTARLGEVLALVREDLEAEMRARHEGALRALSPAETRALAAHLDSEARALVELYLG